MDILLGLLVAASLGTADFFGGIAGRKVGPLKAITAAQFTGLVMLGVYLLAAWEPIGGAREVALGSLAGVAITSGTGFLYRGLALGRMTVVAPVTASVVSIFTVVLGLGRGERPSALSLSGAILAIVATIVVSRTGGEVGEGGTGGSREAGQLKPSGEIITSALAGCSFGVFQTLLDEIGADKGWGPVFMVRVVASGLLGAAVLVVVLRARKRRITAGLDEGLEAEGVEGRELPPDPDKDGSAQHRSGAAAAESDHRQERTMLKQRMDNFLPAAIAGALLLTAHIMLIEALNAGFLSIVGPLTSLTPAFTAIGAWLFLKDPMGKMQWMGLAIALAGVLMVALG